MIVLAGSIGWGDASRALAVLQRLKADYTLVSGGTTGEFFKLHGIDFVEVDLNYIDRKLSIFGTIFKIFGNIHSVYETYRKIKEVVAEDKDKIIVVFHDFLLASLIPFLKKEIKKAIIVTNLPRIIRFSVPKELEDQKKLAKAGLSNMIKIFDLIIYDDFIKEPKKEGKFFRCGLLVRKFKKRKIEYKYPLIVFSGWRFEDERMKDVLEIIEDPIILGRKIEGKKSFGFVKDIDKYISKAKFIITFSGISTIAEALYFKKPLLLIPMRNHLEQYVNSITIENLGFGKVFRKKEDYYKFLEKIDFYKKNIERSGIDLNGGKEVAELLESFIKS